MFLTDNSRYNHQSFIVFPGVLALIFFLLISCQTSPDKKKLRHYNKGIEYLQKHEIQSAILELKNALEIDAGFADAHYQLGLAYLNLREYDKAVIAFDNAASNDPSNVDARLQVANYYYRRQQDVTKAIDVLQTIVKDFPNNHQAHAMLGTVLYAQHEIEQAIASFKKSLDISPGSAEAGIALGRIYLEQHHQGLAQRVFEDTLRQNPEHIEALLAIAAFSLKINRSDSALTYYQRVIALDAQNAAAHIGLAETYLVKNDPETTIQTLDMFRKTFSGTIERGVDLRIRLIAGRAHLLKHNFQEAQSQLQLVTEYVPDLLIGHYSYGLAQAGLGKYEQAISAYRRALDIDPTHLPSRINMAIAYYKNNDPEDAQETVRHVLELAPQHSEGLDLQGVLLMAKGEYEEALDYLTRAEELAQGADGSPMLRDQIRVHRITALLKMNRLDEAIAEFERIRKDRPYTADEFVQLAKAYTQKGAHEDAIAAYHDAITLAPDAMSIYVDLASLYLANAQYDLAEKTMSPLLPAHAHDPQVLYVQGRIDAGNGRLDEARNKLQEVIRHLPQFVEARYALGEVSRLMGEHDKAIKEYEYVAHQIPRHIPSLIKLAYMHLRQQNFEEAKAYAERAQRYDPDNMQAYEILSSLYAQKREFDKALDIIEHVKTTYGESAMIYLSQGMIYLSQGAFDDAIAVSQKAIALDANNPVPYVTIGKAYQGKGEIDQADAFFHQALAVEKQFVEAYVRLGQIEIARSAYFNALQDIRQALRIEPTNNEAVFELGRIYQIQTRYDEAIATYERIPERSYMFQATLRPLMALYNARGDHNKIISLASKYLKVDEQNLQVRYLLAQAYARRGDMNNAAATYREMTLASPDFWNAHLDLGYLYLQQNRFDNAIEQMNSIADDDKARVEAALGKAIAHQLKQEYQQAITQAKAALALSPDNQFAHRILGNIYISQKSFDEAIRQFQQFKTPILESMVKEQDFRAYYGDQSIAAAYYNLGVAFTAKHWFPFAKDALTTALWRTPDNPIVHYALGNLYSLSGDYRNATKSFERVLELQPTYFYVHKELGEMYQKLNESARAIQAYQTYLQQQPTDVMVHIFTGIQYERLGDTDNAIQHYQKAVSLQPENPLALNQLAWLYASQTSSLDLAQELAQKAASLSDSAGIIDTLGWVLYQQGKYAEAIAHLELALQKSPFQPTITYHLALAYYHHHENAQAKEAFEAVLELAPDFELADEIRRLLQEIEDGKER